jgi:beta-xylosidase
MNWIKRTIENGFFLVVNMLPVKVANYFPLGTLRKNEKWSIGIYIGTSPFDFNSPETLKNPVITPRNISDVRAGFIADPFMLKVDQTWYMFFEVFNQQTRRGQIGLATSQDTVNWTYQQIVLAEPFHLSYPYVFEWMNEYYMVPESHQAHSIRLYKASKFPTEWSFVGNLISDSFFLDPSLFHYANKWWLFTETNSDYKNDTLRLYYADELLGPWFEHPNSPIINSNPHIARPGGRVLVMNDKIIRYAQDCQPDYGIQIRAFEIIELTTVSYYEREVDGNPVLTPSGTGWNGSGMHHIDPHLTQDGRWIACVDGRV